MTRGDRSPAVSRVGLSELATPVLSVVLSLRTTSDYGSNELLREKLSRCLEKMEQDGVAAGLSTAELSDLRRPLVAFMDETILNSKWESSELWSHDPLGLRYFGVLHLGQIFFEELALLRRSGDSGKALLEVYFLCLLLGFEGQFRNGDRSRLRSLIQDVGRELGYSQAQSRETRLAPNGKRRGELPVWRQNYGIRWRTVILAGAALVVMLTVFHLWLGDIARRV